MADNLVHKLTFPHCFVKLQGVEQLLSLTKKKLSGNQRSIQELQILWETCCNPKSDDVGYACANAIVSLFGDGLQDGNKVMSTAVNYVSSSSCLTWLLHIIAQLLKLHVLEHMLTSEDEIYHCPYNMRAPPHPFISVITSRPNSYNEVQSQIEYLLLDSADEKNDHFSAMLSMLKPVIVYILLNPSSSSELNLCRSNMLNFLFKLLETEARQFKRNLVLNVLFPALVHNVPTKSTIIYCSKAVTFVHDDSFGVMCCLPLLDFCMRESSMCDKIIAIRLLKQMTATVSSYKSHLELLLVATARVLCTHPLPILHELLSLLEKLLCIDSIVDLSIIYFYFLQTVLLQIQLLLSLKTFQPSCKHLLRKLFTSLDGLIKERDQGKERPCDYSVCKSAISNGFPTEVMSITALLNRISGGDHSSLFWLQSIEHACTNGTDATTTANLLSTLLMFNISFSNKSEPLPEILYKTIVCLKCLVKSQPHLSYSVLPVLCYCMKNAKPRLLQEICYVLPALGNHPYCVAPVLNILKSLSSNIPLKPLALRLMIDLWRNQDRCFPQLQKMISSFDVEGVWHKEESYDLTLVKGIAISTICGIRPHQYGGDMLKLIIPTVQTLGENVCETVRVSLALDALYQLCLNKALNIRTMWNEIGTTLRNNKESLIVNGVLKILSLVPDFKTDSQEHEIFQENILSYIWDQIKSNESMIIRAALSCLSHYKMVEFKIKHLPNHIMPEKSEDMSDEEFFDKSIPGSCYVKLLVGVSSDNLEQYEKFMTSMLKQELNDLPRDIHHRALRSQLLASQPKPLKGISEFITNFYERNRQPSMKASLATSLLLCYNSNVEQDSSGNPIPKSVVSEGRKIMNIMQSLLKEVTIEPNNWQSVMWCAHGWKVFIKKCLNTMVGSRRAELSMQKDKCENSAELNEEIQQKYLTVVLWCRDKITNALKTASKGNPNMQGNAVFALAALVTAVNHIEDSSDGKMESSASEYLKMDHWTTMALDTLVSISNPRHIASGRIMSWCHYRAVSSSGNLSTTQLGKICAIHSLPFISSVSMQKHSGKVLEMLAFLKKGDKDAEDNIAFHIRLSMGHILSILYRENLVDQFSSDGLFLVKECLSLLHENLKVNLVEKSSDPDDDLGSLLGFGLALSSTFQNTDPSFNTDGKVIISYLKNYVWCHEISPDGLQVVTTVLTWTYLSAVANNVFELQEVREIVEIMSQAVQEDPSKAGLCESLGTLCNGLFLCGDTLIVKTMNTLFERWLGVLSKEKIPTREKLAALAGLSALVGANSTLSPIAIDPAMIGASHYLTKLSGAVKSLRYLARNSTDPGIPARAAILLGHLYMSLESNSNTVGTIVPASYDYLPNTSMLRYLFNSLTETLAISQNADTEIGAFKSVMNSISDSAWGCKLPPVNWTSLLSSILLGKFTEEMKNCALRILLSQCDQSPICASLLSSWVAPQKFFSLPIAAWISLYQNTDKVAKCLEDLKFAEFLEMVGSHCIELVQKDTDSELVCSAILSGLIKTMRTSNSLAPSIVDMLNNTVERLFLYVPFCCDSITQISVLKLLSQCVEFLSDANAVVGKYEQHDSEANDSLKSLFVRCCCTMNGSHSLGMCNNTLLLCGKDENSRDEALWILTVCLRETMLKTTISDQIEWLRELMGQIKTLADSPQHLRDDKLVEYFLNIGTIAVAFWSYEGNLLPISGNYSQDCEGRLEKMEIVIKESRLLFPNSISSLFRSKKWESMIQSISDWLVFLLEKMNSDQKLVWMQPFIGALFSIRETKIYQLPSVWCKIVSTAYQTPVII